MEGMGTYFNSKYVDEKGMPELTNRNHRTMSNHNAKTHRGFLRATQLPSKDLGNTDHYGFQKAEIRRPQEASNSASKGLKKLGARKMSDINLEKNSNQKLADLDNNYEEDIHVPAIKNNMQGQLSMKSKQYYSKF